MKKSVVAVVAMAMAFGMGSAYAGTYDITHPLFTPDKGQFMSESTFAYENYKCKSGNDCLKGYYRTFSEEFSYGISDKFVFYVGGLNNSYRHTYDRDKLKIKTTAWNTALKYKVKNDEKTYWDFGVKYYQAHEEEYDLDKYYSVSSTFGKNLKIGTLYVTGAWDNTLNHGKENDGIFTATLGWNKHLSPKLAMGADLSYERNSDIDKKKMLDFGVDFSYKFTPKTALTIFGRYLLDSNADIDCFKYKKGYTAGILLRFLF